MSIARKFMFDRDFDAPAEASEPAPAEPTVPPYEPDDGTQSEPEPEAPTYTEEDLASARAEGVAAGRAEAAAETEAAIEQRIAATLDAITTAIEALLDNRQVDAQAAAENAVAVGAAVVRKAFPALAQRHGTQEVEAMVAEVMERIGEPPRVEVRVPPVMADTIRARLAELPAAQRLSDRTIVTGDETLREGEGRVEWATGGAGRDATTIWREVDAVLARNLSDTAAAAVTDADIGGGDPDDG